MRKRWAALQRIDAEAAKPAMTDLSRVAADRNVESLEVVLLSERPHKWMIYIIEYSEYKTISFLFTLDSNFLFI